MVLDRLSIEKSLLAGCWQAQQSDLDPLAQLARDTIEGNFRKVLTDIQVRAFLHANFTFPEQTLQDSLGFNARITGAAPEEEFLRLVLTIVCLNAFVQANWTGPDLDIQPLQVITVTDSSITEEVLSTKAISELTYGGEPAYHLAQVPVFLRLAQILVGLPYVHYASFAWWRLRVAFVHQQILDEPAALPPTLLAPLKTLPIQYTAEPEFAGRLLLEQGLISHIGSQDRQAAELFVKAARATGLEYELTGALGKRTKFQVNELSQLVLLAESRLPIRDIMSQPAKGVRTDPECTAGVEQPQSTNDPEPRSQVPCTLLLNDDTLLEKTEYTSSKPGDLPSDSILNHINPSNQPPLHPLDQCILLSLCLNIKNTSPAHGLTAEQMSPYVSRVISHPRNWSVHTMALLLRSRLESSRTRTVERSTFQLQALIDQMPTADSTLSERLIYFYCTPLPSKWEMERELAHRLMSLGVIKSALEIFERLEMWEDAVKIYGMLEKKDEGIAIVRDLLEGRKEDAEAVTSRAKFAGQRRQILDSAREAKLWCLLGDLEPESAAEHYSKAWSVSLERSGRAMRSLGGYHFARQNFAEAATYLKRAVAINPLLSRSWFILGCANMRLEDWEGAKNAFSRCIAIDEEDAESWNNLASMYLRSDVTSTNGKSQVDDEGKSKNISIAYGGGDQSIPFENKLRAFHALKQGLKFSYNNWRIWYNYMVVAMDVGELFEACRALKRLVEETGAKLGIEAVDEDVLERLVGAATRESPNEAMGNLASASTTTSGGGGLLRVVTTLLEQTILPRVSSPRIFRAYAKILTFNGQLQEALNTYLDAYRSSVATMMERGETDAEKWKGALAELEDVVDVLRNFGPKVEGSKWKFQARSLVRTFIGRSKDFEDEKEWERLMVLQEELRRAEE